MHLSNRARSLRFANEDNFEQTVRQKPTRAEYVDFGTWNFDLAEDGVLYQADGFGSARRKFYASERSTTMFISE